MISTRKLDHIGVYVADARKAADWYIAAMGFKEIGNFRLAAGHSIIFVRSESLSLTYEFVQQPSGSPLAEELGKHGGRVDHLAFIVDDIEASFLSAKTAGEDIIEGIIDLPELWQNGFRYYMVRTAGGERIEFCSIL